MPISSAATDPGAELAEPPDAGVRAPLRAIVLPPLARLRVLLVEDDESDAYLIEQALAENPRVLEVTVAANGAEALRLVESGAVRPDLALIDLHMPCMDGFALLTHFALRRGAWFPSIVLTSSRLRFDEMHARNRGAIAFVTKPISQAKLREALKREIAKV